MKKILLLAAVALSSLSAWADGSAANGAYIGAKAFPETPVTEIQDGHYYLIYDTHASQGGVRYASNASVFGTAKSELTGNISPYYIWIAEAADNGGFKFFNEATRTYITCNTGGNYDNTISLTAEGTVFTPTKEANSDVNFHINNGQDVYWDGKPLSSGGQMVGWKDTGSTGHAINFYDVLAESQDATWWDVTASIILDGAEAGFSNYILKEGSAYPQVSGGAVAEGPSESYEGQSVTGKTTIPYSFTVKTGDSVRYISHQKRDAKRAICPIQNGAALGLTDESINSLTADNSLFTRISVSDTDFYLYSPSAKRFVSSFGSDSSTPVSMSANPAEAVLLATGTNSSDFTYWIKDKNATLNSSFYFNVRGAGIGTWLNSNSATGSHWFTVLAGEEESFAANMESYDSFITNYNSASTKLDGLVQLCDNADYYNGAYPAPGDEGVIANLLDDAQSTYYHSSWTDAQKKLRFHDLQILIPDNSEYSDFQVQYESRGNGYMHQQPYEIWVYGSVDGATIPSSDSDASIDFSAITWESTPFAKLCGEEDGLCKGNGSFSFNSTAGTKYKALRFEMRRINNESGNMPGTYFFSYGTFKLFGTTANNQALEATREAVNDATTANVASSDLASLNQSLATCLSYFDSESNLQFINKIADAKAYAYDLTGNHSHDIPGYYTHESIKSLTDAIAAAEEALAAGQSDSYTTHIAALDAAMAEYADETQATLSTDALFRIVNYNSQRGYIYYKSDYNADSEGNTFIHKEATTTSQTGSIDLWGFIEQDGNYYLYNVAARKFANANATGSFTGIQAPNKTWVFSNIPSAITVAPCSWGNAHELEISGDDVHMSISGSYTGPVISYYDNNDGGVPFSFEYANREVDQTVVTEMYRLLAKNRYKELTGNDFDASATHVTVPGYMSATEGALAELIAVLSSDNSTAEAISAAITAAPVPAVGQATYNTSGLFTITNTEDRGALIYEADKLADGIWTTGKGTTEEGSEETTTVTLDTTNDNHLWGFIEVDGEYYLYNAGTKKFANAYLPLAAGQAGQANYSWGVDNVGTPVTLTGVEGLPYGVVSIRGGENSTGRPAGMMIINGNNYPVPCVAGSSSDTDGSGFRFTYVREADEQLAAEMAASLKESSIVPEQVKAFAATEPITLVVNHYDEAALAAVAALGEDATADQISVLLKGYTNNIYQLEEGTVYTLENEQGVHAVVNDTENFGGKHSFLPAGHADIKATTWMCVGDEDNGYSFYHIYQANPRPATEGEVAVMSMDDDDAVVLGGRQEDNSAKTYTAQRAGLGLTHLGDTPELQNLVITNVGSSEDDAVTTGITDVTADGRGGVAEWYTLQGVRVARPAAGSVYLMRTASGTVKVLVK